MTYLTDFCVFFFFSVIFSDEILAQVHHPTVSTGLLGWLGAATEYRAREFRSVSCSLSPVVCLGCCV